MEPPDPSPTADTPAPSPARLVLLVLAVLALMGGTWWWASIASRPSPAGTSDDGLRVAAFPGGLRMAPFVGDDACAECHPGHHASHSRSGHSRTFRPALERALVRELDGTRVEDPEMPGVTWSYLASDEGFQVERADAEGAVRLWIDYAFGSGTHTTSFVSLDVADPGRPTSLEHRLSYFAGPDLLGVTPGQTAEAYNPHKTLMGAVLPTEPTLKCFRCHTSATSAEGPMRLDPETMIPNVSCERCHGSAAAHIEAVRRGEEHDLEIAFAPGRYSTAQELRMCGFCHRHPERFEPAAIRVDNPELVRHQPVSLMQSACYLGSGESLSCVSCHDPHTRTSTDTASYEAICIDCHRPRPEAPSQHACPVSPAEGCVGCHMPRRDAGQGYLLTDHWIRVVGPDEDFSTELPPAFVGGPGHGDAD